MTADHCPCQKPALCHVHPVRSAIRLAAYRREMKHTPSRAEVLAWVVIRDSNPEAIANKGIR